MVEARLYVPALSPAYLPDRLLQLLDGGHWDPWTEFLDTRPVEQEQAAAVREWETLHFRLLSSGTSAGGGQAASPAAATSPVERILGRLQGSSVSRCLQGLNCTKVDKDSSFSLISLEIFILS